MCRFPSDPNLRALWIEALVRGNRQEDAGTLPKYPKICMHHFAADDIQKSGFRHSFLKPNTVPSIFSSAAEQK